MAQPTPYDRQFNFADQQAQTPTAPLPADEVDNEFNAVKVTLDQTLENLAEIQRDDGALKNGIVTQDSLAASLSIGFTMRGEWDSPINYLIGDGVTYDDNKFYRALVSHLSEDGETPDIRTDLWELVADFTAATSDAAASAAAAAASELAAAASASAADGSASAASASASGASGSASAASDSADAAAASAALAASVVTGDVTQAVRWDVAQGLSGSEQDQARVNIGLGDGDKGDIVISSTSTVWTIDANAVTNAKFRQSGALSVVGRSTNSIGDVADITAGTDGHVLRRSGTTLGFGTVSTDGIADGAVTLVKQANIATASLIGRSTGGSGVPEVLAGATASSHLLGLVKPNGVERFFNAEYLVWQGGDTFSGLSTNVETSDRSLCGPGVSGVFTVQKEYLTSSQTATIAGGPRFAKKFSWTTAPTAGEGRTGYPKYYAVEEMRDDEVKAWAGKTVRVSAILWVDGGSTPAFLYASMGLGVTGDHGRASSNTISGDNTGVDYSADNEVLYRSASFSITTTPTLHTFDVTLDDLSLATVQSDNAFIIGFGVNYDAISIGTTIHCTLLRCTEGAFNRPWVPPPDGLAYHLASYNRRFWGRGTPLYASSATEVVLMLNFGPQMKGVGGPAAFYLRKTTLLITQGASAPNTSSAAIVVGAGTAWDKTGGYITISGFTGLTPGTPGMLVTNLALEGVYP